MHLAILSCLLLGGGDDATESPSVTLVPLPEVPAAHLPSFAFPMNDVTPILPSAKAAGPGSPRELVDIANRPRTYLTTPAASAPGRSTNNTAAGPGPTFTELLTDDAPLVPIETDMKIVEVPVDPAPTAAADSAAKPAATAVHAAATAAPGPKTTAVRSSAAGAATKSNDRTPLWKRLNPFSRK